MDIQPVSNATTVPQTIPSFKNSSTAQEDPSTSRHAVTPMETPSAATQAPASTSSTTAAISATPAQRDDDSGSAKEQLEKAIENANEGLKSLQNQSNALEFSVDKDLDRIIVRLVDTKTKEVIRQYPPEEVLEIARHMDKLVGKLLKEKA